MSIFETIYDKLNVLKPNTTSLSDPAEDEKELEAIQKTLTSKVPYERKKEVIERVRQGGQKIPAGYFQLRYPIETWQTLSPQELEDADYEWTCMSDVITEKYYRFFPFMINQNKQNKFYWGYLELRYRGGYADTKELAKCEELLSERMKDMRFSYEEKAKYTLLDLTKKVLEEVDPRVDVHDILLEVKPDTTSQSFGFDF